MRLEDTKIEISFDTEDRKVVVNLTAKFDSMTEAQAFIDRLKVFIQQEVTNDRSRTATTN